MTYCHEPSAPYYDISFKIYLTFTSIQYIYSAITHYASIISGIIGTQKRKKTLLELVIDKILIPVRTIDI